MKTSVLGWYNHGNIGDEAYKLAFPKIFPNHDFTFADIIPNCERVFLGGGDVIQPYFLSKLEKLKIPKYAMSVNIKPQNISKYNETFCKLLVRNIVPASKNVMTVPDFTFVLEANPQRGKKIIERLFQENKADLYNRVIVIVLNSYLCAGEATLARDHITFDKVCYDLARVMDNTPSSFLLLPFCNGFPNNDRLAASFLYTKCKYWKKHVILYKELSVQGTLDVISAANMLIGSRLHASIFSCIGGTPFIDLTHHDKTALFLESINKDWGVNYWNFSVDRLKGLMNDFETNEQAHKENLLQIAARNRSSLFDLSNRINL